jgi:UDP-N-acetylmuramoylalanine--D-glutamate ligase
MIPVTSFAGKKVAVFGLGSSGRATARALAEGGASVAAFDDSPDAVAAAKAAGVTTVDLGTADWRGFAALVLAPGVPLTHPRPHWSVLTARAAGIEIIGDVELFCRERRRHVPEAPFVAITGTNGKSTTTALIAHLLREAGRDVALGGNIGTPILALPPPKIGRYHVIECSTFQIDLAPSLDPSLGVLLNLTPDHLDRHGTMDVYARLKERLVAEADAAVIAVDDKWCQSIADRVARSGTPVTRVSAREPLAHGIYSEGGGAVFLAEGGAKKIADLTGIPSLRGAHNAQNAAAAIAAGRILGLSLEQIRAGLRTFPGLPHRMEEVARRGRVLFINDSKATNADATAKALASFAHIYWIAGGRPKEGGIASLANFLPRIAKAYLIGEAAAAFAATIGEAVPVVVAGTLDVALQAAAADAAADPAPESVVLLSPACASYDQFANFERRGDAFRALVLGLNGVPTKGEAA